VQVEHPTGLPGAFHAAIGRPLAGPLEHPAQWVHCEDGDAKKFIQRNGSLFQNNKGERCREAATLRGWSGNLRLEMLSKDYRHGIGAERRRRNVLRRCHPEII